MTDLNELRYPIPPDVLHYEPRFIFGLSATDLLVATIPALLLGTTLGWVAGVVMAVVALSLLKRFERFGNQSLPMYYFQRWQYTRRSRPVHLPLVLPAEAENLQFETWEGDKLFDIEAEA
jgi:hypothetical protein